MLEVGQKAPLFTGKTHKGETLSLVDLKGEKVILFFYPKDNTPGCTAEACDLSENFDMWKQKGFEVIGVSPDNETSHKAFIVKYHLRQTLICDTEHQILEKYEAWGEKSNYGKTYMGVLRKTYLIDEHGIITHIFNKVDTKKHTEQILNVIV
jgi:thioredoxin-dependent peroxiredoxin